MENTAWLSRVTCWFFYPGSVFKTQQQLQRFSCSFKKIHWIIFGIFELNFPKNDQKCSMLWVMDGLCQMIMQTEGTGKKIPMWIYNIHQYLPFLWLWKGPHCQFQIRLIKIHYSLVFMSKIWIKLSFIQIPKFSISSLRSKNKNIIVPIPERSVLPSHVR